LMYRYYELLTDAPLAEIQKLKQDVADGRRHPMDAKADLAVRIISDYNGASAAEAAREEFNRVFRKKESPEDIETREVSIASSPLRLVKLLAAFALAPSNTEAQRLIESGAVHVNDQKITDPKFEISQPGEYLIKVGKRRFLRLLAAK